MQDLILAPDLHHCANRPLHFKHFLTAVLIYTQSTRCKFYHITEGFLIRFSGDSVMTHRLLSRTNDLAIRAETAFSYKCFKSNL